MTKISNCLIVLSLLISVFTSSVAFSAPGGGSESGGGGGDPRATEFLAFAGSILRLATIQPETFQNIDLELLTKEIAGHRDSLATLNPTLQFLPVEALDCFNAAKVGCTRDDGSIEIAANYWDHAIALDRCILTAQELFVHQQGIRQNRYSAARYICVRIENPYPMTKKVTDCMADQSSLRYCEYINNAICEVLAGKLRCQSREENTRSPSEI